MIDYSQFHISVADSAEIPSTVMLAHRGNQYVLSIHDAALCQALAERVEELERKLLATQEAPARSPILDMWESHTDKGVEIHLVDVVPSPDGNGHRIIGHFVTDSGRLGVATFAYGATYVDGSQQMKSDAFVYPGNLIRKKP